MTSTRRSIDNPAILHARFTSSDDILQPYTAGTDRWQWPDVFKNQTSVANAGKAISHNRKAIGRPDGLAERMVFCLERCAGFGNDAGLQDKAYLEALLHMLGLSVKAIAAFPAKEEPAMRARLVRVRRIGHSFGYGVGDGMDEMLAARGGMAELSIGLVALPSDIRQVGDVQHGLGRGRNPVVAGPGIRA
jgi:hypothetical protein